MRHKVHSVLLHGVWFGLWSQAARSWFLALPGPTSEAVKSSVKVLVFTAAFPVFGPGHGQLG